MADWVKLWTTFHDDPSIQNLSDKALRAYVNALSWCGRHDRQDGRYELIGKPTKAVAELVEAGKFEPAGDGIYLVHGFTERQQAMFDMLEARREAGRRGGVLSGQTRRSNEANPKQTRSSASEAKVAKTLKQNEPSRVEEKEPTTTSTRDRVRDPGARVLCELLASLIEANGSKRPTITEHWLDEADRLLRLDKRPITEAKALIRWSQSDPFWCSNVLSMVKFRARYDTLRLKSNGQANGNGQAPAYTQPFEQVTP